MQSVSSMIWTRDAVSISYDDSHYTMGGGSVMLWGSLGGERARDLIQVKGIMIMNNLAWFCEDMLHSLVYA